MRARGKQVKSWFEPKTYKKHYYLCPDIGDVNVWIYKDKKCTEVSHLVSILSIYGTPSFHKEQKNI